MSDKGGNGEGERERERESSLFPSSLLLTLCFITRSEGAYTVPKEDPVALEAKECLVEWKKTLFKSFAVSGTDTHRTD